MFAILHEIKLKIMTSGNFFKSKKIERWARLSKMRKTFYRRWYIAKHSRKGDCYLKSKNSRFFTDHCFSLFSWLFLELAVVVLLLIVFDIAIWVEIFIDCLKTLNILFYVHIWPNLISEFLIQAGKFYRVYALNITLVEITWRG